MNRTLVVSVIVLALVVAFFMALPVPKAPPPGSWDVQGGNSFALRDVRVFDGERFLDSRDVIVQDGKVYAVSPRAPLPKGVPEYDGSGHTLLPGLIDAHTHNFGTAREDALRFGVTTQIDMFTAAALLPAARTQRESMDRVTEADMWSAGTLVTAPRGHGTQFGMSIPTLESAADADAFVAARVAEGSDFIKIVLESGAAWDSNTPTLDEATLRAVIESAQRLGKLALVHIGSREEARLALDAGANGLVHIFGNEEMTADIVALAVANNAFVIPTLAVLESVSGRPSALHQDARLAPWLTPEQEDSLKRNFPAVASRSTIITRASEGTRKLRDAGVTVLAGSDAPNPGTAHGASLHRELALLVAAGFSPAQALVAATSAPARAFGMDDRGRIANGLRADLVLVAGNPAEDITATRAIVAIWKNGYRVDRPRLDAQTSENAPPLESPTLGVDGWLETTDQMMGGASTVRLSVQGGALRLEGTVVSGAPWPWSGAIRTLAEQSMAPVDISAYSELVFLIRGVSGNGAAQVLFFSGGGNQNMPAMAPAPYSTEWREVVVRLESVQGLDTSMTRAISVVSGATPGDFAFEIDGVVLR